MGGQALRLSDGLFAARKLPKTIAISANIFLARTFGEYVHSVWNGDFHYAVYQWRGERWVVPTSPLESDQ